jgi:hypothetical protein
MTTIEDPAAVASDGGVLRAAQRDPLPDELVGTEPAPDEGVRALIGRADARDAAAERRDRAAEARDVEAAARDDGSDPSTVTDRGQAALDRVQAGSDRDHAAEDRAAFLERLNES